MPGETTRKHLRNSFCPPYWWLAVSCFQVHGEYNGEYNGANASYKWQRNKPGLGSKNNEIIFRKFRTERCSREVSLLGEVTDVQRSPRPKSITGWQLAVLFFILTRPTKLSQAAPFADREAGKDPSWGTPQRCSLHKHTLVSDQYQALQEA